jgi:hypothetical protein
MHGALGETLARNGAKKLKVTLIGLAVLMFSGCGLPAPLSYLNYTRMAYDTNQIIQDDTTTMDAALGLMTDMDCKVSNALEDRKVCACKEAKKC